MKKIIFLVILIPIIGTKAFNINCTFGNSYYYVGTLYECKITRLDPSSNQAISGVSGTHQSGKINADVKAISITNSYNLKFVPRGFTYFFPNVIAYSLYQTSINHLNGDEIHEFGEQLEFFQIMSGNLTTIPSSFFNAKPKLVLVDFGDNKIERVGHDLFTPLNVMLLKVLDFNDNRCISSKAYFQPGVSALIDQLKVSCPFEDENQLTTTASSTTIPEETCFMGNINDFVCGLQKSVDDVKIELEDTQNLLNQNQIIVEELESKLSSMKEELTASNLRADKLELKLDQTEIIISKIQQNQAAKDQQIEQMEEIINKQEARLEWLEFQVLKLTTNPCK